MALKQHHYLWVALVILGLIYLYHMSSAHGGLSVGGFSANLGTK